MLCKIWSPNSTRFGRYKNDNLYVYRYLTFVIFASHKWHGVWYWNFVQCGNMSSTMDCDFFQELWELAYLTFDGVFMFLTSALVYTAYTLAKKKGEENSGGVAYCIHDVNTALHVCFWNFWTLSFTHSGMTFLNFLKHCVMYKFQHMLLIGVLCCSIWGATFASCHFGALCDKRSN